MTETYPADSVWGKLVRKLIATPLLPPHMKINEAPIQAHAKIVKPEELQ